jgi:hypothetical protein
MVDIDPLELVKTTDLRCFGEECQERLGRFLKNIPLLMPVGWRMFEWTFFSNRPN